MTVLRNIEAKIESLFEGVFGRAFRTNVQPVELARKLVKEMEDHRVISVSRLYVPNEYTVYLSPADREQFATYEESLIGELEDYLAENARREKYVLLSPPKVLMETDDDLDVGEFGIATRMVQGGRQVTPDEAPAPAAPDVLPGATMVYKPKQPDTEAVSAEELGLEREVATLSWDGNRHELTKRRAVIGRSKDCDVQVADPNVSRRHAEVRQEGAAHWLVDLDSTNGTEVNGRRLKRAKLRPGDTITVGSTNLVFGREPVT
jgi:FHA domain-containing protein